LLAQVYKLDNDCVAAVDLVGGQEELQGNTVWKPALSRSGSKDKQ
jgi:hypothetical protein